MFFDKIYGSWRVIQFDKYDKMLGIFPKLEGKKILDIGIGTGYFESFLKEKGIKADIIGIDISRDKCVSALADGDKLPFLGNSFDVIICLDTVQFIKGNDFVRVLKPGGFALFSIFFNKQNLEERKGMLKKRLQEFMIMNELIIEGKESEYVVLAEKM